MAQKSFGVALPVGVEGRLDEQHHFEAGAVGLLYCATCGTEHRGAIHILVKHIETDTQSIESPRGNGVEMLFDGVAVIVIGWHHLE